MIGKIEAARPSKSGKTLSVQVNGAWYTSKSFELQQAVGRSVVFEPSPQNFPDGSSINWLNDYTFEDQSTGPAAQAFDQAHGPHNSAQASAAQPPQTVAKDRDASIVAQALTKACTAPGDSVENVWNRYTSFYARFQAWNPDYQEYDDSVPY